MNKKFFITVCMLFLIFAGTLSAKTIGLNLEIGGVYTNHQIHRVSQGAPDGFNHRHIKSKHMGGFNIGLSYDLPKNWSIYASTIFSFNNIYVNDTQFGIGYAFKPGKGFNLFLGGAFAVGGSQFNNGGFSERYTNIGGGITLKPSYMFTNKFGIYFGTAVAIYKPINGSHTYKKGSSTSSEEIRFLPSMATSFNLFLGFKIRF